jgi:hypothetical protein
MRNDKFKMLEVVDKLADVLSVIEDLTEDYVGKNDIYLNYCHAKSKEIHIHDKNLSQLFDNTFNEEMSKRKGINIKTLLDIIIHQYKLLDDIDTASDIYKPNWNKITNTINQLCKLRWLYCLVEENSENSTLEFNGDYYSKENRVIFNF